MDLKVISEIFNRFKAKNPKPSTELNYNTPFELLIAVMLSAQSTDKGVNKATAHLFKAHNTPSKILALGEDGLKQYIKTIGLYNTKAANILKTCAILVNEYHSCVPDSREALEKLPGVGRKTANVVLNTAFHQPTVAIDTHLFRVANRIGLAQGKTPRSVENQLVARIPQEFLYDANHWLVLHGRYVCVARKPKCNQCPIQDLCEYSHKTV